LRKYPTAAEFAAYGSLLGAEDFVVAEKPETGVFYEVHEAPSMKVIDPTDRIP
jgi:hypothetical protein